VSARIDEWALTPADAAPEPPERGLAEVAEWIRRARAGEDRAFALLVERHERMVLRTALALLGRLDDAQEAAQDAFLRLHKYLDRFDETRELGPWLYRVVVNVCHDLARRRAWKRLVPLDEAGHADHPGLRLGPETLEDGVSRAQQRRLVQEALATLPPKERTVIVLRDIEGLATVEVARILGSSEGTVRSQACTARLKIKAFVEGRLKP
jgi:RNA polymerase sigma-70 factor (ECF subfamily)